MERCKGASINEISKNDFKNRYLAAKFGLDTDENEPSKVCRTGRRCMPEHLYSILPLDGDRPNLSTQAEDAREAAQKTISDYDDTSVSMETEYMSRRVAGEG